LLARLWLDTGRLSREFADADHLEVAIDTDLAVRLVHRMQPQLAELLEGWPA
jgi:hypothetical protein